MPRAGGVAARAVLAAAALLVVLLCCPARAQVGPGHPAVTPPDALQADTLTTDTTAADTSAPARVIDRGRPKKSTTGAVLRSLAFPGWGQLYTENRWKALGFFLAETGIVLGIVYQNDRVKAYKLSAENVAADTTYPDTDIGRFQQISDERYWRNFEYQARDNRNELFWWLTGVILLSMGDAFVNAHLYGVDWSPDISLESGTVGVTVSCKF